MKTARRRNPAGRSSAGKVFARVPAGRRNHRDRRFDPAADGGRGGCPIDAGRRVTDDGALGHFFAKTGRPYAAHLDAPPAGAGASPSAWGGAAMSLRRCRRPLRGGGVIARIVRGCSEADSRQSDQRSGGCDDTRYSIVLFRSSAGQLGSTCVLHGTILCTGETVVPMHLRARRLGKLGFRIRVSR